MAESEARTPVGAGWWLGLSAIALGGGLLRLLPWPRVFTSEGVLFYDGDSYYHMRRIAHSIEQFPALLERDPWMNFPHGGTSPWPPGFDWTLAALTRLLVGTDDRAGAETIGAWVPVICGVLAIVAIGNAGRRLAGVAVGWAAAGLLALLPAAYNFTQLGYLDHHATVAWLGTALFAGVLVLVDRRDAGPRIWPWLAGAGAAALLLVWPGALLHLGVAQAGALAWTAFAPSSALAVARARRLAGAHALCALALFPFAWGRGFEDLGAFTPLALTSFQPVYFGCAALALAVVAGVWAWPVGARAGSRLASGAGVALAGVAIALLIVPELAQSLERSSGWFTGDEQFHDRILELRPLLGVGFSAPMNGVHRLTWLLFAFPLAWGVAVTRRPHAASHWMLGLWSAAFGLAALSQARFTNSFAAPFALVWAVAGVALARAIWTRWEQRPVVLAAVVLVSLLVASWAVAPAIESHVRLARGLRANPEDTRMAHVRKAARFIATHHPTREDADPGAVLSAWGIGHQVRYYAEAPVIQDNFGPYVARENVAAATRYYAAVDEERALAELDALGARYILVEDYGAGVVEPYPPGSLTRRLLARRGSEGALRRGGRVRLLPALTRHRLVYETQGNTARIAVYERVGGARIEGEAPAGAAVTALVRLEAGTTPFIYRTSTQADSRGRYRLRFPYASGMDTGGVRTLDAIQVVAGTERKTVEVPEQAARTGSVVAGPRFTLPAS
ncbi:MAG: hypothetical protein AAF430_00465 [Myxococcota bacterium]